MRDTNILDKPTIAVYPAELDVTLLPGCAQDRLFRASIDLVKVILKQPGGREKLDAITAARKAAQAEKKAT